MELARQSGFVQRTPRALNLHAFTLSCLVILAQPVCSLSFQAAFLGLCASPVSKQALHKRFKKPQLADFLQALLGEVLRLKAFVMQAPLSGFARILVHDSTTIAVDPRLAAVFPGPANQHNKAQAHIRIQSLIDLHSGKLLRFLLSPFTANDQLHASRWLDWLNPDDLLIRDLGYFTLKGFHQIQDRGAFFLSRLRFGTTLFCCHSGKPIALEHLLDPNAPTDRSVRIGKNLHVRLVAIPLDAKLANERRRKARLNRDKRLAPSPLYYHALGWTLLITNANIERLPLDRVLTLYRLRWRIESVFKLWKSYCGLRNISLVGTHQTVPLVLGLLVFSAIVHNRFIPHIQGSLNLPKPISEAKIIPLIILLLVAACILSSKLPERFLETIPKCALYESRSRNTFHDLRDSIA